MGFLQRNVLNCVFTDCVWYLAIKRNIVVNFQLLRRSFPIVVVFLLVEDFENVGDWVFVHVGDFINRVVKLDFDSFLLYQIAEFEIQSVVRDAAMKCFSWRAFERVVIRRVVCHDIQVDVPIAVKSVCSYVNL